MVRYPNPNPQPCQHKARRRAGVVRRYMSQLHMEIETFADSKDNEVIKSVLFKEVGDAVARAATTFDYLRASWSEGIWTPDIDSNGPIQQETTIETTLARWRQMSERVAAAHIAARNAASRSAPSLEAMTRLEMSDVDYRVSLETICECEGRAGEGRISDAVGFPERWLDITTRAARASSLLKATDGYNGKDDVLLRAGAGFRSQERRFSSRVFKRCIHRRCRELFPLAMRNGTKVDMDNSERRDETSAKTLVRAMFPDQEATGAVQRAYDVMGDLDSALTLVVRMHEYALRLVIEWSTIYHLGFYYAHTFDVVRVARELATTAQRARVSERVTQRVAENARLFVLEEGGAEHIDRLSFVSHAAHCTLTCVRQVHDITNKLGKLKVATSSKLIAGDKGPGRVFYAKLGAGARARQVDNDPLNGVQVAVSPLFGDHGLLDIPVKSLLLPCVCNPRVMTSDVESWKRMTRMRPVEISLDTVNVLFAMRDATATWEPMVHASTVNEADEEETSVPLVAAAANESVEHGAAMEAEDPDGLPKETTSGARPGDASALTSVLRDALDAKRKFDQLCANALQENDSPEVGGGDLYSMFVPLTKSIGALAPWIQPRDAWELHDASELRTELDIGNVLQLDSDTQKALAIYLSMYDDCRNEYNRIEEFFRLRQLGGVQRAEVAEEHQQEAQVPENDF